LTNRLWPADAVGGSPAYSGRALRQTQSPFVAGATAARPLGARSGVRPGTSTGTVNATSTTWYCNPHAGVLDVQTAAEAGPYTYAVDSTVSGAIVASNASNPRTDIVFAQVTDAAEDGAAPGQAPVVTIGYLAGTASASAPAPAAPARSIVLARINVPKTGGGNPTVTWVAPYAVGAGGILPVKTATELTTALAATLGVSARATAIDDGALYEVRLVDSAPAWVAVSTHTMRVPAGTALPQAGTATQAPPQGAPLIRRIQYVVTGTNGSGVAAARISFADPFPHACLHVTATTVSGSGVNPVLNAGDVDRFGFRPVWPSTPNGSVAFTYEAVGW